MTTDAENAEPLRSLDDLLTPEETAELRADLLRIHKTMYPCWAVRSGASVEDPCTELTRLAQEMGLYGEAASDGVEG